MAQLQASTVAGTLTTTGAVGIGTNNPGYPLYVYLNSNSGLLSTIRNVSTGTAQYVELKIGQGDSRELRIGSSYNYSSAEWNQNWIYSVDRNLALKTDNGYAIRFYTDGTVDANERMRIASGGNVGIGTITPLFKLDVRGDILAYYASLIGQGLKTGYGISEQRVGPDGGNKPFVIYTSGDYTNERMRITSGGTLLLGDTVTPYEPAWKGTAVFGTGSLDKVITGTLVSNYTGATIGGHNSALSAWANLNLVGGNLIFRVEEVEYMRMNTSGNLGIGTATPAYKFHLQGSNLMATLRNSSTSANQYTQIEFIAGSRDAYIWLGNQATTSWAGDGGLNIYTGTGNMDFWTAATQRMRITSGGNVGIGTTTPQVALHIGGGSISTANAGTPSVYATNGVNVQDGSRISLSSTFYVHAYLQWDQSNFGTESAFGIYGYYGHNFQTRNGSALVIRGDSNYVGIGITNPSYPLHVANSGIYHITAEQTKTNTADTSAYATFYCINNASTSQVRGYLGAGGASVSNTAMRDHVYVGAQTNHGLRLFTNDSARVTVDTSGNVGIGTATPNTRLDISDGSSYFRIWGNSAGDFQAPALAPHIASGDFTIYAGSVGSGTFRMVVKNGGNVGIGTTNPTHLLHVNGAVRIQGTGPVNSLRLDDTGGTSRNAMYVSSSNYLVIDNINYTGLQLVHTGSAPTPNDGNGITSYYGTDQRFYLAEPNNWLAIRINTTNYVIPMYQA